MSSSRPHTRTVSARNTTGLSLSQAEQGTASTVTRKRLRNIDGRGLAAAVTDCAVSGLARGSRAHLGHRARQAHRVRGAIPVHRARAEAVRQVPIPVPSAGRDGGWVRVPANCRGSRSSPSWDPRSGPRSLPGTTAGTGRVVLWRRSRRPNQPARNRRRRRLLLRLCVRFFSLGLGTK